MLDGSANQVSEMVPPSRIFDQLGKFVANCSETFLIVDNVSDLWPVLLSTEAVLKFAWDPEAFMGGDPNATEMAFFLAFAKRNFGAALAEPVAAVYKQYVVKRRACRAFGAFLRASPVR